MVWQPPDPCLGRVLVLPGGGYTVDHPVLAWACHVADSAGWQVCAVRWHYDQQVVHDPDSFVELAAEQLASSAPQRDRTVVIGKSLGTYAARWTNDRGYAAVWLTPLLTQPAVGRAIADAAGRALLIGGTGDRSWDSELAATSGCDIVEIEGANHNLIVGGDWRASFNGFSATLESIEAFLHKISGAGSA